MPIFITSILIHPTPLSVCFPSFYLVKENQLLTTATRSVFFLQIWKSLEGIELFVFCLVCDLISIRPTTYFHSALVYSYLL